MMDDSIQWKKWIIPHFSSICDEVCSKTFYFDNFEIELSAKNFKYLFFPFNIKIKIKYNYAAKKRKKVKANLTFIICNNIKCRNLSILETAIFKNPDYEYTLKTGLTQDKLCDNRKGWVNSDCIKIKFKIEFVKLQYYHYDTEQYDEEESSSDNFLHREDESSSSDNEYDEFTDKNYYDFLIYDYESEKSATLKFSNFELSLASCFESDRFAINFSFWTDQRLTIIFSFKLINFNYPPKKSSMKKLFIKSYPTGNSYCKQETLIFPLSYEEIADEQEGWLKDNQYMQLHINFYYPKAKEDLFQISNQRRFYSTPYARNYRYNSGNYNYNNNSLNYSSAYHDSSKEETGCVGLQNQGATCYMNSLLQSLFHIPAFRKIVYEMPLSGNEDLKTSIPLCLQRLFAKLQFSNESCSTKELTTSFGWNDHETFIQHDVQEFCTVLISKLSDKMKGTPLENSLNLLLAGKFKSYIRCIDVDFESSKIEEFFDLSMIVKGALNLEQSFKIYVEPEKLNGDNQYKTDQYGPRDAIMGTEFIQFPPVLHIHLRRFQFDYQTMRMAKINDRFEFPLSIDLKPYMVDDQNSQKNQTQNQEEEETNNQTQNPNPEQENQNQIQNETSNPEQNQNQNENENESIEISESNQNQIQIQNENENVETIENYESNQNQSQNENLENIENLQQNQNQNENTENLEPNQNQNDNGENFEQNQNQNQNENTENLEQNQNQNDNGESIENLETNNVDDTNSEYIYDLYGVLVHSGSISGGHYFAFLRTSTSPQWFKFNDSSVSKATLNEAVDDNFGGSSNSYYSEKSYSAYMLVYIRRNVADEIMKPVSEEEVPDYLIKYAKGESDDSNEKEVGDDEKKNVNCETNSPEECKQIKINIFDELGIAVNSMLGRSGYTTNSNNLKKTITMPSFFYDEFQQEPEQHEQHEQQEQDQQQQDDQQNHEKQDQQQKENQQNHEEQGQQQKENQQNQEEENQQMHENQQNLENQHNHEDQEMHEENQQNHEDQEMHGEDQHNHEESQQQQQLEEKQQNKKKQPIYLTHRMIYDEISRFKGIDKSNVRLWMFANTPYNVFQDDESIVRNDLSLFLQYKDTDSSVDISSSSEQGARNVVFMKFFHPNLIFPLNYIGSIEVEKDKSISESIFPFVREKLGLNEDEELLVYQQYPSYYQKLEPNNSCNIKCQILVLQMKPGQSLPEDCPFHFLTIEDVINDNWLQYCDDKDLNEFELEHGIKFNASDQKETEIENQNNNSFVLETNVFIYNLMMGISSLQTVNDYYSSKKESIYVNLFDYNNPFSGAPFARILFQPSISLADLKSFIAKIVRLISDVSYGCKDSDYVPLINSIQIYKAANNSPKCREPTEKPIILSQSVPNLIAEFRNTTYSYSYNNSKCQNLFVQLNLGIPEVVVEKEMVNVFALFSDDGYIISKFKHFQFIGANDDGSKIGGNCLQMLQIMLNEEQNDEATITIRNTGNENLDKNENESENQNFDANRNENESENQSLIVEAQNQNENEKIVEKNEGDKSSNDDGVAINNSSGIDGKNDGDALDSVSKSNDENDSNKNGDDSAGKLVVLNTNESVQSNEGDQPYSHDNILPDEIAGIPVNRIRISVIKGHVIRKLLSLDDQVKENSMIRFDIMSNEEIDALRNGAFLVPVSHINEDDMLTFGDPFFIIVSEDEKFESVKKKLNDYLVGNKFMTKQEFMHLSFYFGDPQQPGFQKKLLWKDMNVISEMRSKSSYTNQNTVLFILHRTKKNVDMSVKIYN